MNIYSKSSERVSRFQISHVIVNIYQIGRWIVPVPLKGPRIKNVKFGIVAHLEKYRENYLTVLIVRVAGIPIRHSGLKNSYPYSSIVHLFMTFRSILLSHLNKRSLVYIKYSYKNSIFYLEKIKLVKR